MKKERKDKAILSPSKLRNLILGKKLLIDTNIIIYLTDKIQPYEELSRIVFSLIEEGKARGIISLISIVEIMQGPLKKGLKEMALEIKEYLLNFPNMFCQMVDKEVLEYIGSDNRVNWTKLRTMDSLIIASGLRAGVDKIVSNDLYFKKAISNNLLITFDL